MQTAKLRCELAMFSILSSDLLPCVGQRRADIGFEFVVVVKMDVAHNNNNIYVVVPFVQTYV